MPPGTDPTFAHARREAIIIASAWAACTAVCCLTCYLMGYQRAGVALGAADVKPTAGVPAWFFWGVIAPWAASTAFTFWFAGWFMADDDLGEDHAADLQREIQSGEDGDA